MGVGVNYTESGGVGGGTYIKCQISHWFINEKQTTVSLQSVSIYHVSCICMM